MLGFTLQPIFGKALRVVKELFGRSGDVSG